MLRKELAVLTADSSRRSPLLSSPSPKQANRVQIMRWLAEHIIDPNDPRNAPLLELLKTHEASSGLLGDLFRLDIFPDVAMRVGARPGLRAGCVGYPLSFGWRPGKWRSGTQQPL